MKRCERFSLSLPLSLQIIEKLCCISMGHFCNFKYCPFCYKAYLKAWVHSNAVGILGNTLSITNFVFVYAQLYPWETLCEPRWTQKTAELRHTHTHPSNIDQLLQFTMFYTCYVCDNGPYLFTSGVVTFHPISDNPPLPLHSNPQAATLPTPMSTNLQAFFKV